MTGPPMSTCRRPFIRSLALASLALLAGCGRDAGTPAPLDPSALAVVSARPGVPREQLARAIDALFTDAAAGETRALLVEVDGRVVAERYGPGFDKGTRQLGWSLSKTVTGLMIGLLVSDGRLRLDESVPIPAWQRSGDPRGEITLRQLLQMRSGLRHVEQASPVYAADTVRMLFLDGRSDMAAYAEAQPLVAEPGRRFAYSSATSVILGDLAARVLTDSTDPLVRRQVVGDYLHTRLLQPLGMGSAVAEFDNAGTLAGSSLIHATARDWGRLGEFLRNGGAVKGAQILPHGWVEFMTRPSPAEPGYGAQLWLNHDRRDGGDRLLPGALPPGVFAALGHMGQYVIVSPRQGVTLVRLGHSTDEERRTVRARLAEILRLFPEREAD
ncbi:serine hydrolase domain-containing protein [Novosphingobium bradum]|uniref:Serine hydrolase domain-containing protein n=1 Tax=Novosphingobium bradum TaxID=1737444 RepID=A0ABV7IR64_9SPHN